MDKKVLDWGSIANTAFDDKRRKATGSLTGKELFAKAYAKIAQQEEAASNAKAKEPLLKQELLKALLTKSAFRVIAPFANPTEALGGIVEGSEEDDGFYMTKSKTDEAQRTSGASFQEVMETIPTCELTFKSWDKQLGQFIFKASNGKEYAIYDKPRVLYQGNWITNPGYYGLLYNTNFSENIREN